MVRVAVAVAGSSARELSGRIERLIAPTVAEMGFAIVRVRLAGEHRPTVQIMVEHPDGGSVTVDDCARISRAVSALLDVEDLVHGAFILEVSSPGIDRPLVRLEDFRRFAGHEAKVKLGSPVEGRKRFRGRLLGVAGERVQILVDGAAVDLPYRDIVQARLVLTEELLAAAEHRQAV